MAAEAGVVLYRAAAAILDPQAGLPRFAVGHDSVNVLVRREDAESFVEEVPRDEPELAECCGRGRRVGETQWMN